jgi:hypothetical protein
MDTAFFKAGASGPHFLDVEVSSKALRIATTDGERASAALNPERRGKSKYTEKRRAQCLWLVAHSCERGVSVACLYACLGANLLDVLMLCAEMGLLRPRGELPWRRSEGAGIWGNGHHLDFKEKIGMEVMHRGPYETVRLLGRFECGYEEFRSGLSADDVARSTHGGGVAADLLAPR